MKFYFGLWYSMQKTITSKIVSLAIFCFSLASLQLYAQGYSYTVESFEDSAWPTSEPDRPYEVRTTTGYWEIRRCYPVSSLKPPSGTKYISYARSGYLRSPLLPSGAGILTLQVYTTDASNKTVTVSTSSGSTAGFPEWKIRGT